ncbi:hypothetical protein [Enterovibrio norvegicus]|uniref:hypothetical protein n=1 Tax=Enterovibrio norvegicus TaxID=188144 RepID=UPI0002EAD3C6|nr:hypothetical protein [Enterovibrio norvegicus]OEF57985.1 hypothetical protein A1OU_07195 [Enterovibrio norvegicus]
MDVSINELSFKGQFKSIEEFVECLIDIASAIKGYNNLSDYQSLKRTKLLLKRPVIGDKTLDELRTELLNSEDSKASDVLGLILQNLVVGPFFKEKDFDALYDEAAAKCGEKITGTSLHAYVSRKSESIEALISAKGTEVYDTSEIEFECDRGFKTTLLNFQSEGCFQHYKRYYEPNPKHEIKKDKLVAGEVNTKMDLAPQEAQECLNNGVGIIGIKQIFSYRGDQWYEFPPHRDCLYHGFPIGNPQNNAAINRIIRVFGAPPYADSGFKFCLND